MEKEEQVTLAFRGLVDKLVWLNKFKMEDQLRGYKPSEVHCVEAIMKNSDPNVTRLAESLYMTKGAISKLTKKLIEKKLIESYQKPANKKEVYFKLTDKGKSVYQIHEDLHKEFQERDKEMFAQITDEQLDKILKFVDQYNNHLDAEIKKQGLEIG
ncbi:winged helix DNA-binding protein [Listeria sp. PSOL-1]|uniref:winged helix DNA-binding protein n=1 Tax=Listeria sp. PSOL-1 TaxID=1844999 RepID=UPI0013D3E020|nr:winged helix DNA-binding protein [Listeria sp. PSOL-1]